MERFHETVSKSCYLFLFYHYVVCFIKKAAKNAAFPFNFHKSTNSVNQRRFVFSDLLWIRPFSGFLPSVLRPCVWL